MILPPAECHFQAVFRKPSLQASQKGQKRPMADPARNDDAPFMMAYASEVSNNRANRNSLTLRAWIGSGAGGKGLTPCPED